MRWELVTFVANHPACWHSFRQRAARLCQGLESRLPADRAHGAKAPHSLGDIITELSAQKIHA
jgi:hypothetical protein